MDQWQHQEHQSPFLEDWVYENPHYWVSAALSPQLALLLVHFHLMTSWGLPRDVRKTWFVEFYKVFFYLCLSLKCLVHIFIMELLYLQIYITVTLYIKSFFFLIIPHTHLTVSRVQCVFSNIFSLFFFFCDYYQYWCLHKINSYIFQYNIKNYKALPKDGD